jgi:CrcB protein
MIQGALWVFLGGGLGSLARWGFGLLSKNLWTSPLASVLGTLAANFVACVLLGYVLVKQPQERHMWLWAVGFCGGFSTFSTFSNEVLTWLRAGDYGWAIGYVVLSLLGGLAGVVLGARWA